MTLAAQLLGEREIIFPEIAAICAGLLVAPKVSWKTDKKRILIFITLCAVLGMAVVRIPAIPKWLAMSIAFLAAQLMLMFSKTTFAPMISAAVLPVMLGTRTPAYLASAVVFTSLALLCRYLLEKFGFCEQMTYEPPEKPKLPDIENALLRTALAGVFIFAAISVDVKFFCAPPLLVLFTEMSNKNSPARKRPVPTVLLIGLCAFVGSCARYFLCVRFDILPLFVCSAIVIIAVLALMTAFEMYLPPAGAVSILAMLVPEKALMTFAAQITAGAAVFVILALIFFRDETVKKMK